MWSTLDEHSPYVTCEAQPVDILCGAPTGLTLHHQGCIPNVTHPVSSPVNQAVAAIFTLLHIYFLKWLSPSVCFPYGHIE